MPTHRQWALGDSNLEPRAVTSDRKRRSRFEHEREASMPGVGVSRPNFAYPTPCTDFSPSAAVSGHWAPQAVPSFMRLVTACGQDTGATQTPQTRLPSNSGVDSTNQRDDGATHSVRHDATTDTRGHVGSTPIPDTSRLHPGVVEGSATLPDRLREMPSANKYRVPWPCRPMRKETGLGW